MKGTFKALAVAGTTAALLAGPLASSGDAHADDGGDAKVTICHAAGRKGTAKYETLTIGWPAANGPAGHFNENGTPRAGHEDDYFGACKADPVDETPGGGVDETPGGGVDETPGGGVDETPGGGVDETPGGGVDETPGGGVDETPGGGVDETPGGGVDETPGGGVVETPEIVVETPVVETPGGGVVETPGGGVVETPEIVVEATTPVLASEVPVPTTAVATDSRTLPETGSTNTWLALSALTLCGLGSVLWALSRRSPAA